MMKKSLKQHLIEQSPWIAFAIFGAISFGRSLSELVMVFFR